MPPSFQFGLKATVDLLDHSWYPSCQNLNDSQIEIAFQMDFSIILVPFL